MSRTILTIRVTTEDEQTCEASAILNVLMPDEKANTYNFNASSPNVESSVKEILYLINKEGLNIEKERLDLFYQTNLPKAIELAESLQDLVGNKWFTLNDLDNKTLEDKAHLELQLNFLNTFNLLTADRDTGAGKRYKITIPKVDQVNTISTKILRLNSQIKELELLKSKILGG